MKEKIVIRNRFCKESILRAIKNIDFIELEFLDLTNFKWMI